MNQKKIHKTTKVKALTRTILSLAMVISLMFAPLGEFGLKAYATSDIEGHWAENIIREAVSMGLVSGYEDGSYKPESFITREEFYTLLTKIMTVKPDATTVTNTPIKFKDVVLGEWYEPVIKTAVACGITSGYEDGSFGIGRLMSRQEAAKVVASVIQTKNIPAGAPTVDSIRDKADIGEWAYPFVNIMFQKKYMKGDDQNNLHPTNALKRAEAFTILLNVKKNEPIIAANADKIVAEQQQAALRTGCQTIHGTGAGVFITGEGTSKSPYEITDENQLNHMRVHAVASSTDSSVKMNQYFVLKNNISISSKQFAPIGTETTPFKGHLDGGNKTIRGLSISGTNYVGLIGFLDSEGSVTNLTVDNSTIEGRQYVGGLVGYSKGLVEDCTLGSSGEVMGTSYTGGIVGYSEEPLYGLENKGTVTGTLSYTGGIVGFISASGDILEDNTNFGQVTGNDKLGGIAGAIYNLGSGRNSASVSNCRNAGTVSAGAFNAGGIVGFAESNSGTLTISDCINSDTVKGAGVNGGIVGIISYKNITVKNSSNTGTVEGNGAGGIVGNNQGLITNCFNDGVVDAKLDGGGIVAFQQDTGRITESFSMGSVQSQMHAGGIAGQNDSYIDNCYNAGRVKSSGGYAGGIVGRNTDTVENTYNAGKITADVESGALVGRNSGILYTSYWLDSTGSSCTGLDDRSNGYDPKIVKALSHRELSGQDKIIVGNKYVFITDQLNLNNLSQSDIKNNVKPISIWNFDYRSTLAPNNLPTGSDGIPNFNLLTPENKPGNIIEPSDLSNKYLYPVLN